MSSLNGKIILVTGASAGIGLSTAETLAKLGAKVVGCARNTDKIKELNKSLGNNAIHAVKTDMTKEKEVLALFKEIGDKYGKLDILINNAGMGGTATLLEGEFEGWKAMLDLNILALTLATREAVKLIESGKSEAGHIVNINSIVGHHMVTSPGSQFYSATKHMVTALTEATRKTAQEKNIRVSSVSPGVVETEFFDRAFGKADPELAKKVLGQYKVLESKDIADAIVYILSVPAHVNIDELTITPQKQQML